MKFKLFLEGKKQKLDRAAKILREKGIEKPEEVSQRLFNLLDKNTKYLVLAAIFYHPDRINFEYVIRDFLEIERLLSVNILGKKIEITYRGAKHTFDDTDSSWQKFENFVHHIQTAIREKQQYKKAQRGEIEGGKLIVKKNLIEIRRADKPIDAIVLGRNTNFCISQAGTPHFNTYRIQYQFTIYFIFDENFSQDHPLSIVVYMIDPHGKILLTDKKNNTGTIQNPFSDEEDFGNYTSKYLSYLKKRGIDHKNLLISIPLSKEEKEIVEKFGRRNIDVQWFASLSSKDMENYISMGHSLSPRQIKYLIDKAVELDPPFKDEYLRVLHSYFYSGMRIPKDLLPYLKNLKYMDKNLLNHYLKYRIDAHNIAVDDEKYTLIYEEYSFTNEKQKRNLILTIGLLRQIMGKKFDSQKFLETIKKHKDIRKDDKFFRYISKQPAAKQIEVYKQLDLQKHELAIILNHVNNIEVAEYVIKRMVGGRKANIPINTLNDIMLHSSEDEFVDFLLRNVKLSEDVIYVLNNLSYQSQWKFYKKLDERGWKTFAQHALFESIKNKQLAMLIIEKLLPYKINIYFLYHWLDGEMSDDKLKEFMKNHGFIKNIDEIKYLLLLTHDEREIYQFIKDNWKNEEVKGELYRLAYLVAELDAIIRIRASVDYKEIYEKVRQLAIKELVEKIKSAKPGQYPALYNTDKSSVGFYHSLYKSIITMIFLDEKNKVEEILKTENDLVDQMIVYYLVLTKGNQSITDMIFDNVNERRLANILSKLKEQVEESTWNNIVMNLYENRHEKSVFRYMINDILHNQNYSLGAALLERYPEYIINWLVDEKYKNTRYEISRIIAASDFNFGPYIQLMKKIIAVKRIIDIDDLYITGINPEQILAYHILREIIIDKTQSSTLHNWLLHVAMHHLDMGVCKKIEENATIMNIPAEQWAKYLVQKIKNNMPLECIPFIHQLPEKDKIYHLLSQYGIKP